MAYIWDVKEILELIENNKEYEYLFDEGRFEDLRHAMERDGHMVSRQMMNHVVHNVLEIDIGNTVLAGDMKYTIVGTQDNPYGGRKRHRYAGLNNKNEPVALTMGEPRTYTSRVYFKDMPSAQKFFDKFIEHPKIKDRQSPVEWRIIPITKHNSLAYDNNKGVEMELINSSVGACYKIKD